MATCSGSTVALSCASSTEQSKHLSHKESDSEAIHFSHMASSAQTRWSAPPHEPHFCSAGAAPPAAANLQSLPKQQPHGDSAEKASLRGIAASVSSNARTWAPAVRMFAIGSHDESCSDQPSHLMR